ncbi:unnamed protein product [Ilex paraguariensis]|uniref:FAF domain-containing protein n=1 Tax=Ilex paraguariensis TaxID=185542 RepID=A0ABC8S5M0_9AQUA
MSSIVCQGLRSCLEPRLIQPCVLRHKLAPPKAKVLQSIPNTSGKLEHTENSHYEDDEHDNNSSENNDGRVEGNHKSNNNGDSGGWSFLQALTNKPFNSTELVDTQKVYVHPLVKRSSSTLSTKSLDMCTESLGSETGSEVSESIDEFSSLSWEGPNFGALQRSKSPEFSKKLNGSGTFPPPLTSISGSDCVRVRPHREDGRLVIKAVTVPSSNTNFQAERVNGRLRLSLKKDYSFDCNNEVIMNKETESNEEDEDEVAEHANFGEDEVVEHDDDDNDDDVNSVDGDGDNDNHNGGYWGEGMDGDGGNVGFEVGIGELSKPRRCKEGGNRNKGMPKWGPLWVQATS